MFLLANRRQLLHHYMPGFIPLLYPQISQIEVLLHCIRWPFTASSLRSRQVQSLNVLQDLSISLLQATQLTAQHYCRTSIVSMHQQLHLQPASWLPSTTIKPVPRHLKGSEGCTGMLKRMWLKPSAAPVVYLIPLTGTGNPKAGVLDLFKPNCFNLCSPTPSLRQSLIHGLRPVLLHVYQSALKLMIPFSVNSYLHIKLIMPSYLASKQLPV